MNNKQIDMLDLISIMSFVIALMNLDENITQSDIQEAAQKFDLSLHETLEDIHRHLSVQDEKLNAIIRMLERNRQDENYTQNAV